MLNLRPALPRVGSQHGVRRPALSAGLLVTGASAAVAASVAFQWWGPVGLLVVLAAAWASVRWIVLLARRDSRALIALWLIFGLNRSVALLLPGFLGDAALLLDDIALGTALAVVLLTGRSLSRPSRCVAFYAGMAVFGVSGVVSALVSGITAPAIILGTWLGLKLFVAVYVCAQFDWSDQQIRRAFRVACWLTALVVAVALLQAAFPGQVNAILGVRQRVRLGESVITSIFREPAQYSTFAMFAIVILLAGHPLNRRRALSAALVAGAALLSLRLKALIDVVLILITRALTSPARLVRASAPLVATVAGAAALYLGSDLFAARSSVLLGDGSSPRRLLYAVADELAADNAPLGAGFGSFGSEASTTFYSPVYDSYGLSQTYGFTRDRPSFTTDAAYATVLGETGWVGALGVAVALLALGLAFLSRLRQGPTGVRGDCARAGLMFTLVLAADSIASPQFFAGFTVVGLGMLYSMAFSTGAGSHGSNPVDAVVEGSGATDSADSAGGRR